MTTFTISRPLLFLVALLTAASVFAGNPFKVPEPKLVYKGTAPGLDAGVLVIRKADALEDALSPLAPGVEVDRLDAQKTTLLRIVGRERENACRETTLDEVSTNFMTATVSLKELVPAQGCPCAEIIAPPRAWLVQVGRVVRRAKIRVTDVVVPCDEAAKHVDAGELVLVYQGSWDENPGGQIITTATAFRKLTARLGLEQRGPQIDFSTHAAVVITGRPRENSCRKTTVLKATLASPEEAIFTLEEVYPAQGQLCGQIFLTPKMFIYRVPKGVTSARTVTQEKR